MIRFNSVRFLVLILAAHVSLALVLATGSLAQIGVTAGVFIFECMFVSTAIYHRLLSHRSWEAPRWVEVLGTVMGMFTFTGTPITRTLSHRYHHRYADTERDPHSPQILGVFRTYLPMLDRERKMDLRLVRDLLRDPLHVWCHKHYLDTILTVVGLAVVAFGWKWALAIFVAPGALCWMNISICNIFCHLKNGHQIGNDRLLASLTFGEGWHLSHHENPDAANFGGSKLDMGFVAVRMMRKKSQAVQTERV